jgi:hypothetical protein
LSSPARPRRPRILALAAEMVHPFRMSKVEQIEAELEKLSPAELQRVRDWLDDFVEDRLEFTAEFEAAIQNSEKELAAGVRPRVRKP